MAKAIEITDATFEAEVVKADTPVLVDFWAPWCGPCKTIGTVLEQLAGEREGQLKVVKMNIDEQQEQAVKLGVMLVPTLVLYKNGEPVERLHGGVPPRAIAAALDRHLDDAAVVQG